MSKKEIKKYCVSDKKRGYVYIDRIEAYRRNWALIKKLGLLEDNNKQNDDNKKGQFGAFGNKL